VTDVQEKIVLPVGEPEVEHVVQLVVTMPVFGKMSQVMKAAARAERELAVSLHRDVLVEVLAVDPESPTKGDPISVPHLT
jgi:hypothetical protein